MQRYKLTIEYDGTGYHGWQFQENLPSVQGTIQEAFRFIEPSLPTLHVAGRTDAGVHALAQVAHVDITPRTPYEIKRALNHQLKGKGIVITNVEAVSEDFHARFTATKRCYIYRIINRPDPLALEKYRAWHVYKPLTLSSMQKAAHYLTGHHDFTSFRASQCQSNSPMKTLEIFEIRQNGALIEAHLQAKSFLHHQVRNMMGTLKAVGEGAIAPEDVLTILEARRRCAAGITAPAHGLFLEKVVY